MNGSDGKPTTPDDYFESLMPLLEKWFDTETELSELPAEVQEWMTRFRGPAMLARLWGQSTPGRRRNMAQQWVWMAEEAVLRRRAAVLRQRARALGADLSDDLDSIIPENVAEKSRPDTERGKTSKGGAPPRPDRDDFDREVVRRLTLDGGDVSLTQFRNGMKQWASDKMEPPPDARTVERWIDRLVLPGLLPD